MLPPVSGGTDCSTVSWKIYHEFAGYLHIYILNPVPKDRDKKQVRVQNSDERLSFIFCCWNVSDVVISSHHSLHHKPI